MREGDGLGTYLGSFLSSFVGRPGVLCLYQEDMCMGGEVG